MFIPPPGARVKAIHFPSGDHSAPPTGSSNEVTISGHPPVEGIFQTCGSALRLETNARVFPSGEKLGERDDPTRAMRATASPASSAVARQAANATGIRAEARTVLNRIR